MRRAFLAAVFAGSLLAACQTTQTPGSWIQTGCGFLVSAEEVAALLKTDPTIASIEQALSLICQAASLMKARARGTHAAVIRIHGVTLHLVRR